MFRLKIRNDFGAMWLSDYIDNGYIKEIEKPKAPIIGADGNVFILMGICSRALRRAGYSDKVKEMTDRITSSKSYDDALSIMCEYIEPVDQDYNSIYDYNDNDIGI